VWQTLSWPFFSGRIGIPAPRLRSTDVWSWEYFPSNMVDNLVAFYIQLYLVTLTEKKQERALLSCYAAIPSILSIIDLRAYQINYT